MGNTVYFLGAGFTKNFDESAPIDSDCIKFEDLESVFKKRQTQSFNAFLETLEKEGEYIKSVEGLLTRLQENMPYDNKLFPNQENRVLYNIVKKKFINRIKKIKGLDTITIEKRALLNKFTKNILENSDTIITTNYDELIDESMFNVNPSYTGSKEIYWHPDGGYGFFLHGAEHLVRDSSSYMDKIDSLLLKIHGSINWKIKQGYDNPTLDQIYHNCKRFKWHQINLNEEQISFIKQWKDPSFFIPPTLTKKELSNNNILRLVRERSFDKLQTATQIVFMGYSLPKTDIAIQHLIRESLNTNQNRLELKIHIVSREKSEDKKEEFENRYKTILSKNIIKNDKVFYYQGIDQRINKNILI